MIAMAIANDPKILVADEATTALDVTIQAQVLEILEIAREETHAATILITHDLGLVAELADRVVVMYAGRVAEIGDATRSSACRCIPTPRGSWAASPDGWRAKAAATDPRSATEPDTSPLRLCVPSEAVLDPRTERSAATSGPNLIPWLRCTCRHATFRPR